MALFSSLRVEKFKGLAGGENGTLPLLYMSMWPLDEAERCVAVLPQLCMADIEVSECFKVFGGSARMHFNRCNTLRTIQNELLRS